MDTIARTASCLHLETILTIKNRIQRAMYEHVCPDCDSSMSFLGSGSTWLPDGATLLTCRTCDTRLIGCRDEKWSVILQTDNEDLQVLLPSTIDGFTMESSKLSSRYHPILTAMRKRMEKHTYPIVRDGRLNLQPPLLRAYFSTQFSIKSEAERDALLASLLPNATHIALCPDTGAMYTCVQKGDEMCYRCDIENQNTESNDVMDVIRALCDWHLVESL